MPLRRLYAVLALPVALAAQRTPGHPIGKVTTIGNLVALELDSGAVSPERRFDLDHKTVRFTPGVGGYRVQTIGSKWDPDFGNAVSGNRYTLTGFHFPFSGRTWDTLTIANGAITFGGMLNERTGRGSNPVGNRTGAGFTARSGFQLERYPLLETVGRTFINMIPGIAALVKTNLNGPHYVKELADRVVVTWTISEAGGGIQAFSWTPMLNRVQATLHKDGAIEISYDGVTAGDGIVGVFPAVNAGAEKPLTELEGGADAAALRRVTLTSIDGLFVRATFEMRDALTPGTVVRLAFDASPKPAGAIGNATVVWTVRTPPPGRGGAPGVTRFVASGNGVESDATVDGNTVSVRGILPAALSSAKELVVLADANGSGTLTKRVKLESVHSPEIDLSSGTSSLLPVAFEGFHWPAIPRAQDVACSVITALGDKFDFIASYSDFRVDNPEGGTPSTGPRGGNVSGIGSSTNGLENYCSTGRLQWMYVEPVSTSAVQIQEKSPDGRFSDYNYAMSQIGHELGHRWAADARALVNGETIPLGPVHYATGLHIPAAFPYSNPAEADAMGGSTWKDNGDGTYTQLDRDYYSPAKGYSWLGLYLMGLAKPEEVPPFFILRNLQRTGQSDPAGHPIYRGDKTVITINDVIASMGPRVPDFEHAQKAFNTAIVVMTLPGRKPTPELISSANNIAEHWITYWSKTTGGRSTMTVSPR
ncbi:MAG TPA: hypothetical protein VE967_04760 [Gemmatimonadaceae bacterium]|nr:hypothetical protein [Gemmatimonadaceae bacterium]